MLRAAPPGTGIIAGGPMRAVFETLGIQDVVAKSLGSSNPYNMVRATFDALRHEDSPRGVAARRGKKVSEIVSRRRETAPARPRPRPRHKARNEVQKRWPRQSKRKTIVVEQIGSPIRRPAHQRATLIGLGLNKMHKRRTLIDSPQVRGMVAKVEPSRAHRR